MAKLAPAAPASLAPASLALAPAPAILRFKFSEDIMTLITYFAKLHQFEDRHTYKANWLRWLEENHDILQVEIAQLEAKGYTGDIVDKMYKAGRYYFRKKVEVEEKEKEKEKKGGVNKYITMNKSILEEMDKHILTSMRTQLASYTPALGYEEFCKQYCDLLSREKQRLMLDEDMVAKKFKKTYKNRYFIVTR